ncbi:peptidoglycan D,D-transpeptidase FtsI family protein [Thalassorhabdus alkalitolerans]|uniref:serine-type D-Ala-D-Ala carboxypeptidase n=1 Tax=Thalassorhabdus alkalitolerans TaxID=2282697 RepID=A0ABW0YKI9_9BACI
MARQKHQKNKLYLNILFVFVFLLFSALILRLGFLQIVEGDDYVREVEGEGETTGIDSPRGLMYDRHGNKVVDNELVLSLTYTNRSGVSDEERIEIARQLNEVIEIDLEEEEITDRDLQDFWIVTNEEEAQELVSEEEIQELTDDEYYEVLLDRIPEEEVEGFSEQETQVAAIWREMNQGFYDEPHRIKQDIDEESAHVIGEHLDDLPGVDLLRDSQRKYMYEDSFSRFLGRTGAIPSESLDDYLARGYERSDDVGRSFLELEYEEELRGEKRLLEENVDGTQEEEAGQRGRDLVLSVDMDLQQEIENIIEEEISGSESGFINEAEAYVVMMDPNTGELLSVAGYDDHLGAISSSYEMGSTVKAASVMIGLEEEIIEPNTIFEDREISLPDTPPMSSVTDMGDINDLTALERSSNIYMAEIAMRMAGYDYEEECCWDNIGGSYQIFRNYYSQFGLGEETGIDLPSESSGLTGDSDSGGNLLYLSFGQYDTYTPLQLTQYISTIANGGSRLQPNLVNEIREPSRDTDELGAVRQQHTPNVLNQIDVSPSHLDRVQEGLWRVMNGEDGTARDEFEDADYVAAGKTGTAEVRIIEESTGDAVDGNNQALVAYAPYDEPEVAVSVVVPYVYTDEDGGSPGTANRIAREAMDAFFELQEERQEDTEEEDQEGISEEELDELLEEE